MKKVIFCVLTLLTAMSINAQTAVDVESGDNDPVKTNNPKVFHVETAGTLSTLISDDEKYTIDGLTLTGELNGTDFRLIRDMAGCDYLGDKTDGVLAVLDISGARIVAGGERYLDTNHIPNERHNDPYFTFSIEKDDVISDYLFVGCKLVDVKLPEGITEICPKAFNICDKLVSISIPTGVTNIDERAFMDCRALTSLTLPNNLISIGSYAFAYCGMTSLTIPSSVTTIGDHAFAYCNSLTAVTIPNGVTTIGDNAFTSTAITSVTIPGSVTNIGKFVFPNLNSIIVEDDNTVYDSRDNCNAIIETKTNTLIIGCNNTTIPNSVTSIGDYAFYSCTLYGIKIPNSVTHIGAYAFYMNIWIRTVTIPSSVKTIGDGAFKNCWSMNQITINGHVEEMGSGAFSDTGRPVITALDENPSDLSEMSFNDISRDDPNSMTGYGDKEWFYANAKLKVPKGTLEKYQSATGWKEFKNIEEIKDNVSITIGNSGKTTYTTTEALDFSEVDGIKAYVATGYEASGTIWLTRVKQVPANTPILIKGEANQTYEVPVMIKCLAQFENMFQGAYRDITFSSTDSNYKNYYMAGGVFKPVPDNYTLKAGKCYLTVPTTFNDAKAGEDQTVKIADSGKSSYAPPVDVDLTNVEGLKAYAATGYDAASQTIWLTRINKIQAGEGVILKGEAGKTYTLPSTEVQAYYGNMLVGNIDEKITINETSDDSRSTNFYLASGSFKKVNGTREIGTNKSYLTLPTWLLVSNARGKQDANIDEWFMEELETETLLLGSIGGDDEGGTTRIDAITNDNAQPDVYYNLQGQRINAPKKGIYIKNGKKVVIRSTTK